MPPPKPEGCARVWPPLLRAAGYAVALFVLADVLLLRGHATDGWAVFGENGRLEIAQDVLLALSFVLLLHAARRRPVARPLAILLAGVALAALVREQNNAFKDEIGHGVWQMVVAVVLLVTGLVVHRVGGSLRAAVADLVAHPAFGWMAAGVAVFAFGQVLDELPIWHLLLGSDVPYAAQRMAEECAETAAYGLIAAGTCEWGLAGTRHAEGEDA